MKSINELCHRKEIIYWQCWRTDHFTSRTESFPEYKAANCSQKRKARWNSQTLYNGQERSKYIFTFFVSFQISGVEFCFRRNRIVFKNRKVKRNTRFLLKIHKKIKKNIYIKSSALSSNIKLRFKKSFKMIPNHKQIFLVVAIAVLVLCFTTAIGCK